MRTQPSGLAHHEAPQPPSHPFSNLPLHAVPHTAPIYPAQAARMNPNQSLTDLSNVPPANANGAPVSAREHGTAFSAPPSRSNTIGPGAQPPPIPSPEIQATPASQLHFDGLEPKLFPGVVSRRRRSSIQRPTSSSFSDKDGWAASGGLAVPVSGGTGVEKAESFDAVAEEQENGGGDVDGSAEH